MEQNRQTKMGLLEYLAAKVGCMYLSDLHLPFNAALIQRNIANMEPAEYSLREWNDAVEYLTGESSYFSTREQAAAYLKKNRSVKNIV